MKLALMLCEQLVEVDLYEVERKLGTLDFADCFAFRLDLVKVVALEAGGLMSSIELLPTRIVVRVWHEELVDGSPPLEQRVRAMTEKLQSAAMRFAGQRARSE